MQRSHDTDSTSSQFVTQVKKCVCYDHCQVNWK